MEKTLGLGPDGAAQAITVPAKVLLSEDLGATQTLG